MHILPADLFLGEFLICLEGVEGRTRWAVCDDLLMLIAVSLPCRCAGATVSRLTLLPGLPLLKLRPLRDSKSVAMF